MDLILHFANDRQGEVAIRTLVDDLTKKQPAGLVSFEVTMIPSLLRSKPNSGSDGSGEKPQIRSEVTRVILGAVNDRFTVDDAKIIAKDAGFTSPHLVYNALARAANRGLLKRIEKGIYEVVNVDSN